MKKILVYGLTDTKGGVESFLINYYKNFDRERVQLDFISNTETTVYEEEIRDIGGKIYRVCSKLKNPIKFKRDMDNIFKMNIGVYDAIWVNLCSLANIDYLIYAKRYGIKIRIVHSHNSSNMSGVIKNLFHKINRMRIGNIATHYWACSNEAAKWFYKNDILGNSKFLVVNNAIEVNKFSYDNKIRDEYRTVFGLDGKFVLGAVGRFHFQKNHEFLIDVFNEVHKEYENAVLLLIGIGPLMEDIVSKVNRLNLQNSVMFLEERDDVNNLMQAMDVFLMPSKFEGLPVSAVEAQAAGLKCILSDKITKEIKISSLVEFIPIDQESINEWKKAILNYSNGYNRTKVDNIVRNSGFDIKQQAKYLEKNIFNS